MKHVGKMKNNGAKVVVVYRTIPGEPHSALVVGTNVLGESYHNSLMSLVEDVSAQQANELADILNVRKFPDGNNMLTWLHTRGHLKKVSTDAVLMTPNTQATIQLDELNRLIADQRGITLEQLAGGVNDTPVDAPTEIATIQEEKPKAIPVLSEPVTSESILKTAEDLIAKANEMLKEAVVLQKKADELSKKKKKATV